MAVATRHRQVRCHGPGVRGKWPNTGAEKILWKDRSAVGLVKSDQRVPVVCVSNKPTKYGDNNGKNFY